ncbi:MAG: hypothetical protein AUK03_14600 [Anaerolineae bacterium CG2_30_64_16]|nr:MAG: hypothetical protein AUK03_14600 [Anaerolineae bacterium CG2_30_64_16]
MFTQRTHVAPWQIGFSPRRESITLAHPRGRGGSYPAAKRTFDLFISVILLIVLAPLMLTIAIAIRIDSRGPAIHVQRRVGLNGRVFRFYKFRSMTNGHDHTQEHRKFATAYINGNSSHTAKDGNGHTVYKPATNGATVTRVGRWLRRTSLDELPQLFNVCKGDMSLVGPRPSMDYEVALYTEHHRKRLAVLPGLTGWAQINGRSSLGFDRIVALDLEYIHQRSLRKDLLILLKTVAVVFREEYAG